MPVLIIITVLIGYAYYNSDNANPPAKALIPETDLPSGFTYMGTHNASVYIGDILMEATEGVYRYNDRDDVYIQIIKNDDPEALITLYKEGYKRAKYSPFVEISMNGHKATQVTDYATVDGKQVPNYAVVWTAGDVMIIVASPTASAATVTALATATGY